MPFRTVGGEQPHAISRLYTQFHEGVGQPSHSPQKFLRGNSFPMLVAPHHLRARSRVFIDCMEDPGRACAVIHSRCEFTLLTFWMHCPSPESTTLRRFLPKSGAALFDSKGVRFRQPNLHVGPSPGPGARPLSLALCTDGLLFTLSFKGRPSVN